MKFPLPNSRDPFSLRPGSVSTQFPRSKASDVEGSSSLGAAIAGARVAATQFTKKDENLPIVTQNGKPNAAKTGPISESLKVDSIPYTKISDRKSSLWSNNEEKSTDNKYAGSSSCNQPPASLERHPGAPSKVCRFFSLVFNYFNFIFHVFIKKEPQQKAL